MAPRSIEALRIARFKEHSATRLAGSDAPVVAVERVFGSAKGHARGEAASLQVGHEPPLGGHVVEPAEASSTVFRAGPGAQEFVVAVLALSLIHISEPTRPY